MRSDFATAHIRRYDSDVAYVTQRFNDTAECSQILHCRRHRNERHMIDCIHVNVHFMYGTLLFVYRLVSVIFDFMLI